MPCFLYLPDSMNDDHPMDLRLTVGADPTMIDVVTAAKVLQQRGGVSLVHASAVLGQLVVRANDAKRTGESPPSIEVHVPVAERGGGLIEELAVAGVVATVVGRELTDLSEVEIPND
jgi:hypothetical protein